MPDTDGGMLGIPMRDSKLRAMSRQAADANQDAAPSDLYPDGDPDRDANPVIRRCVSLSRRRDTYLETG